MVNFDSALPGTAAEAWAADGRLATIPPLELGVGDRVIVVAAHPDDETLGAGGLISECSLQGIPVQIVIVTDGAASHTTSTSDERDALVATRAREARAALQILAPESSVTFLGFADGGVRERREQLYDALATVVENAPGTTVLVAPWRGDGHRDHRVVGEACASLAAALDIRLMEYPIWMWHWSTPDNAVTPWSAFDSLALRPQSVAAKRRAIAEYSSQTTAGIAGAEGGGEPVLHPRFLRNFGRTTEVFVTRPIAAPVLAPAQDPQDTQVSAVWAAAAAPAPVASPAPVSRSAPVSPAAPAPTSSPAPAPASPSASAVGSVPSIWSTLAAGRPHRPTPGGASGYVSGPAAGSVSSQRSGSAAGSEPRAQAGSTSGAASGSGRASGSSTASGSGSASGSGTDAPTGTPAMNEAYFDERYARRDDPWGFETRWYESRKRALTLAALPAEKYESTLEIGCSIGVLTELLAARSAAVLAVDISQQAVDRARARLRQQAHVTVERADVGRRFPQRHFDLIVLSEVGYYFDPDDLDTLLDNIENGLGPTGTLVMCHWRHPVDDYPLTGDEVHQVARTRPGLHRLAAHVEEDFILEVFSHDPRSVAERTGLR
jgi:LmbE family N-acetylglucosaminyl deacetylase/SAM-dependent methyltransferase